MTRRDPNLLRIESVAAALVPVLEQIVFVGGSAAGLLLDDDGASPIRVTLDVDVVSRVETLLAYHSLERRLERAGFRRDQGPDAPVCRWLLRDLQVDFMAANTTVLGFSNRWYPLAVKTAMPYALPSGRLIQLVNGPVFLATKFEAFTDRGNGDILASHDLEDIVSVLNGRRAILAEIELAPVDLRAFLGRECRQLLENPDFIDRLPGILGTDDIATVDRMRDLLGKIASS